MAVPPFSKMYVLWTDFLTLIREVFKLAKIQTVGKFSEVQHFWSAPVKSEALKTFENVVGTTGKSMVAFTVSPILVDQLLLMNSAVKGCGPSVMTETFGNIFNSIMGMFDAGVVIVIIFAGAAWALGHRPKALEILIGVCCGYILARHSIDIRNFLSCI